jgi:hypothetical protein
VALLSIGHRVDPKALVTESAKYGHRWSGYRASCGQDGEALILLLCRYKDTANANGCRKDCKLASLLSRAAGLSQEPG